MTIIFIFKEYVLNNLNNYSPSKKVDVVTKQFSFQRNYRTKLGAPSKLKNGKKCDTVHNGGRGLGQNPSLKLWRKNDMSNRMEGGYDVLSSRLSRMEDKREKSSQMRFQ